jgi:hypothetical protein
MTSIDSGSKMNGSFSAEEELGINSEADLVVVNPHL